MVFGGRMLADVRDDPRVLRLALGTGERGGCGEGEEDSRLGVDGSTTTMFHERLVPFSVACPFSSKVAE